MLCPSVRPSLSRQRRLPFSFSFFFPRGFSSRPMHIYEPSPNTSREPDFDRVTDFAIKRFSQGAKEQRWGRRGVKEKRRRRRSKLDSANFYFFCFWFWSLESFSKILFWEFMTENVLCRVGKLLIEWRNHFLKSSLFSILGFMRATYESLFREYRVKAGSCFKWNGGIAFHPDIFKRWRITKLLK